MIADGVTFSLWFGHAWHLGRSKAIGVPNFDQVSQSKAEILLLPVSENKRFGHHIEILLPVSILTFSLSSACDSALAYQILCKLDDRRRSCDVILILRDDCHDVANLLPISGLATSDTLKRLKLSALQTSTKYLDPRPRYYYFRFWKQTTAILKFYFLFQPFHCHWHVVFHRQTKFHRNRIIRGRVMTSQWFSRWRPSAMLDLV